MNYAANALDRSISRSARLHTGCITLVQRPYTTGALLEVDRSGFDLWKFRIDMMNLALPLFPPIVGVTAQDLFLQPRCHGKINIAQRQNLRSHPMDVHGVHVERWDPENPGTRDDGRRREQNLMEGRPDPTEAMVSGYRRRVRPPDAWHDGESVQFTPLYRGDDDLLDEPTGSGAPDRQLPLPGELQRPGASISRLDVRRR